MNKIKLQEAIILELDAIFKRAQDSALRAYQTATHKENVAENKYDTLGLEASYLAHGQGKRVVECETNMTMFRSLKVAEYTSDMKIDVGALVVLSDENDQQQLLFLGPCAGGVKFKFENKEIFIITPSSPIGRELIGRFVEDEFEANMV